jgi:carboxymethylenebutenolidase
LIEIQVDGKTVQSYLALPQTGKGPGVIVLHAWWGLNDFFKELCERLAQEGFVAIAPDLYDGKIASSIAEAEELVSNLDGTDAEAKIIGALEYLRQHSAVQGQGLGAIGFSLGASYALWLSTIKPQDIAAVVSFYGNGEANFALARAAYLGHYAEVDEWEPAEGVRQLEANIRAAGRAVTFYIYPGVGHWFFESNRPDAYNADAARLAWERTLAFLQTQLSKG